MDFEFSESERAVVNLVRKVAQEKFRPTAFEKRLDTKAPIENLKILADLGLLGLCLPEEYGGSGRPYVEAILAIEDHLRR